MLCRVISVADVILKHRSEIPCVVWSITPKNNVRNVHSDAITIRCVQIVTFSTGASLNPVKASGRQIAVNQSKYK